MKIRLSIDKIVGYILLLFIILDCNTVYSTSIDRDFKFPEIITLLSLVLLASLVSNLDRKIINRWLRLIVPYFYVVLIIMLFSVSADKLIRYSARFIIFIPIMIMVLMIYKKKKKDYDLLLMFGNLMTLIGLLSLIFWIFVSLLNIIPKTGDIVSLWGTEYIYPLYYGLYTERQSIEFFGNVLQRNQAFFTEGPMFNVCLSIALMIEVFLRPIGKNKLAYRFTVHNGSLFLSKRVVPNFSFSRVISLVITIMTTFTTTGIIILVAIALIKFFLTKPKQKKYIYIKTAVGLGIIFVAISIIAQQIGAKVNTISWLKRMDDYKAGFSAWSENWIIGNGYDNNSSIVAHMDMSFRNNNGYSNALFTILAQGGIFFLGIYFVGFLGWVKGTKAERESKVFSLLLIMLFISVLFQNTFLMMLMLAFGYSLLAKNSSKLQSL